MAHGFLKSFDGKLDVHSAGTEPADKLNPIAVQVMNEAGIDISSHFPKNVDKYINDEWDYLITVCNDAMETCPVFRGKVKHRLHFRFDDPANKTGSGEFIMREFRRVRDEIKNAFRQFYSTIILKHEK